jgi:sphinganine-1-phosphate aldolase
MLAYREQGRERGIEHAEIVAPETAHVAFEKAAFYYNMKLNWVPVNKKTGEVRVSDMKKYINKNTVCLITSCPNYPYGTIDPIEDVGKLARKYGVGLHVDCCLGGFIVPFADDAGLRTKFDFRCKDVTSISVDPHKYGLAPKGVSVCLFKNNTLRNGAIFSSSEWIGGIYATPTHAGSRGGAPSVGAWVSMLSNGYEGFKDKARKIIEGTKEAAAELSKNKYIKVVGNPQLGVLAFLSDKLSCFDINDILSKKGWHAACLQYPPGVHLSVTNYNLPQLKQFVADVNAATEELSKNSSNKKGSVAQLYGTAATLPESIVREGAKLIMDVILKA